MGNGVVTANAERCLIRDVIGLAFRMVSLMRPTNKFAAT
jgi:hypothetical protein